MPSLAEKQLLDQVKTMFSKAAEARLKDDKRSHLASEYMKGNSWNSSTLARLDAQRLPHLRINMMWPILMRIWGSQIQNQGRVKIIPLQDATVSDADTFNKLYEALDSMNASSDSTENQFSEAFKQSTLLELGGWLEVILDTDMDPRGIPVIKWVDANDVYKDPNSKRADMKDCRFVLKSWFLTKDDAVSMVKQKFPGKLGEVERELKENPRSWINSISDTFREMKSSSNHMFGLVKHAKENSMYRLVNTFLREDRDIFRVRRDNRFEIVQEDEFQDAIRKDVPTSKQTQQIIKSIITIGDTIVLENKPTIVQNGMFPLIPVYGVLIDGENKGLGYQLTGLQEEYQAARSSQLHIVNSTANGGWQVEDQSLTEPELEKLESHGAATGYIQIWRNSAPKKIQPNPIAPGILERVNSTLFDAERISSITPNTTGRRDSSNETGVLLSKRVEQAMITLEPFFRNLKIAKERAYIYRTEMVQKTMTGERMFRILNQDSGQMDSFVVNQQIGGMTFNEIGRGRFGATVEEVAKSVSERQRLLESLLITIQNVPPELVPWHIVFSLHDWPPEQREQIVEYIQDRLPPGQSEQQLAQIAALQEQEQGL
jgi:hypothetical protein